MSGNAVEPSVLIQADIVDVATLVTASPDAIHVQKMVATARALNPKIKVIVRTHNAEESVLLYKKGHWVGLLRRGRISSWHGSPRAGALRTAGRSARRPLAEESLSMNWFARLFLQCAKSLPQPHPTPTPTRDSQSQARACCIRTATHNAFTCAALFFALRTVFARVVFSPIAKHSLAPVRQRRSCFAVSRMD